MDNFIAKEKELSIKPVDIAIRENFKKEKNKVWEFLIKRKEIKLQRVLNLDQQNSLMEIG